MKIRGKDIDHFDKYEKSVEKLPISYHFCDEILLKSCLFSIFSWIFLFFYFLSFLKKENEKTCFITLVIKFFDYTKLLKIFVEVNKKYLPLFRLDKKHNITSELIDYKKPIKFLPNNYTFSCTSNQLPLPIKNETTYFSLTISRTTFLGEVAE